MFDFYGYYRARKKPKKLKISVFLEVSDFFETYKR
jgi:hypothetical protein